MKKYIIMLMMLIGTTMSLWAQNEVELTGSVTDNAGEPLIGANVIVKNMKGLGVIADMDGNFKIKVKEYQTLVFSYLGYKTKEVVVKNNRPIKVVLEPDLVNAVDEVVVTGMGSQKKLTLTGAVTNVDVDNMKHYGSSNLSNVLAGNAPGIIAMQTSGQPGKNTSEFWIRGISTFGAGKGAYILVDGFERSNIDDLNIEDIESFSVLKDASATAIYGSKGANGVVLITTKHGKDGKIKINGKFETSYNTRTITPEFVDGVTYANLLNEAYLTLNKGWYFSHTEIELFRNGMDPDLYPNVNWKDLILKNGANSYRGNINLSGGGSTSRYYASISYVEDEGMYKTDATLRDKYDTNANYKRWNYRVNLDIDITPTTILKLGVSGDLSKRNAPGMGDTDTWNSLFGYNAILTPVVYSNGYVPMINMGRDDQRTNPWVMTTQSGYHEEWNNNVQTNVTLEQDLSFITKGLRFTGRFGYDTYNYNWINHDQQPERWYANGRDKETGNIIFDKIKDKVDMHQSSGNTGSRREFLDFLLHWNRSFLQVHNIGANLKYTFDENIQTQNIGEDIKNSVSRKYMALAGQLTYNYDNRYFIDCNFGYNGSENFADGHRFGFFPAYSLAWNVAEEPWVQKQFPWLDMFKIRYSNGKVGNDYSPTRFPYLYTIDPTGERVYNFGTADHATRSEYTQGYHYSAMASPNVTWEIARKTDIGIDLVLFHNRFSLTVDYFHEKRTGIYMARNYLPSIIGLESSPWANVGSVRSQGFDGNFKYEDRIGEVGFTIRGNFTYSKNKILDYDVEDSPYSYQYQTGYQVDQLRGLVAEGLFRDFEDIRNSPKQMFGTVMPGDIKYKDVNGDGVVDDNDVVAIGATRTPNLYYGLGLSVMWKGFDMNLLFQGAGKSTFMLNGKCVYAFSQERYGQIFSDLVDNRWIDHETATLLGIAANEDPNADYPRLDYVTNNESRNNYRASTFWMRDGRYLRLKNVDFGYTLPKQWVNKYHLNDVRIYIQGSNLLTWSKFKLWDPEMGSSNGEAYPITKSVTMGIQVNL